MDVSRHGLRTQRFNPASTRTELTIMKNKVKYASNKQSSKLPVASCSIHVASALTGIPSLRDPCIYVGS